MKQQIQQKLRELITKHNPELLELKVGTEIKYQYNGNIYEDVIAMEDYEYTDSISVMRKHGCEADSLRVNNFKLMYSAYPYVQTKEMCEEFSDMFKHTHPIVEIIGNPIELRHLLIALKEQHCRNWSISDEYISFEWIQTGELIQINLSIPLLDNEEKVLQGLIDILE